LLFSFNGVKAKVKLVSTISLIAHMITGYEMTGKSLLSQTWCSSAKTATMVVIAIALLGRCPHHVTAFSTSSFASPMARYRPQQSSWPRIFKRGHVSLQATSVPSVEETKGEGHKKIISKMRKVSRVPKKAVRIYTEYATRLWNETNPIARKRIAQDKAVAAVRAVEHIMQGEEYVAFSPESEQAREELLCACQAMLKTMEKSDSKNGDASKEGATKSVVAETSVAAQPQKARRSILFGAMMGAIVACWVFSGNYIFTGIFTLMTVLGQLEYYRMVMNTGIYPARRISVVGACSMFLTVGVLVSMSVEDIFLLLVSLLFVSLQLPIVGSIRATLA
jgi:hypothetical protein